MSRIKSIIQKLFPPEQKVLNIFKIAYLVLFIIRYRKSLYMLEGKRYRGFGMLLLGLLYGLFL